MRSPRALAGILRAAAGVAALAWCAGAGAGGDGDAVRRTWDAGRVGVPVGVGGDLAVLGSPGDGSVREVLAVGDRAIGSVPAVLVMHGCAGISGEEETVLYLLTLNGYAVFMPDSFARPGRVSQCDVATATAVIDPRIYAQREAELRHAQRRIGRIPWVDARRVFLLGFSEGAAAAAVHEGGGFAGVVLVGWHCGGRSTISGLRVPTNVPVLALLMADDPWYEAQRGRHCGEHFGARAASRSLVLPGTGHSVLRASDVGVGERVKRELLGFLRGVGAGARITKGGSQ